MMRIDPGNKCFIIVFTLVVVAVIGFLIASIFIDVSGDVDMDKIEFGKSKFWINVKQQKSDKRYVVEVFNGEKLLQNVILGTDFGPRAVQVIQIENGFTIKTTDSNEISFTVDDDSEDFATLYVKRSFKTKEAIVTDCLFLNSEKLNWYGGHEQMNQSYPIQKFENISNYAYVPKEESSAAIMERYWLSSSGFFIIIDYESPLFIDQNSEGYERDHICFTGKKALPYDIHTNEFVFNYRIGAGDNAKETHLNVIAKIFGTPIGMPDERLVRYPIWNTWVRYGRNIDTETIASFAQEIIDNGFKRSLIDIDDFWEDCYGSLSVNQTKFPDMYALTTDLHSKEFIVGMWVHPFINKNCEPYFTEARDKNYLVKSHSGSIDTKWWNSGDNGATHVDFTNPEAHSWYRRRLEDIQATHGIDIFKFDAGETSWFPEDAMLTGDPNRTPSLMTKAFVELASDFGNQLEIRTGWGTQYLHVFVRMLDFDSRWSEQNGLRSLIPTLLQFNLNGYVFVLPDMIGGNRYHKDGDDDLDKNLFIRWLQASVFMPALQFSVAPWEFDNETIEISRKFTELHEFYADVIIDRFGLAMSGHPVNPPIWWLDPEDEIAQAVSDEYLLGEKILVAPVVEQGKYERDVYLPAGVWKDGNSETIYPGGQWILNYPAPIDVLPFFILCKEDVCDAFSDD